MHTKPRDTTQDIPDDLTLGQVCAELVAPSWHDEPSTIPTSLGDFSLRLDTNIELWHHHQISRLEFTLSRSFQLGHWTGSMTIVSPSDIGGPPRWDSMGIEAYVRPPFGLSFGALRRALESTDWTEKPEVLELEEATLDCFYRFQGKTIVTCDFGNPVVHARLDLTAEAATVTSIAGSERS